MDEVFIPINLCNIMNQEAESRKRKQLIGHYKLLAIKIWNSLIFSTL